MWGPALRGTPSGTHPSVVTGSRPTPWSLFREHQGTRFKGTSCVSAAEHKMFGHVVCMCTFLKCSERKPFYICKEEDTLSLS